MRHSSPLNVSSRSGCLRPTVMSWQISAQDILCDLASNVTDMTYRGRIQGDRGLTSVIRDFRV